jgi:hypothetical protein
MGIVRKAAVVRAVTPGPGPARRGVGKPGLSPVAKAAVVTSPGRRRR